ncbi:MAG TPA: hypothetical protein VIE90_21330 [Candidatus Binatia bacterium]
MQIDLQAISPSPILLLYWEEPRVAAHFSRKQNEAISRSCAKAASTALAMCRFKVFKMQLQSRRKPKASGCSGWKSATPSVTGRSTIRASHRSSKRFKSSTCYCSFIHLRAALTDDPLAPVLGNFLQFTFRTTMIVERMILKGMFDKYPNLRLCLSHCGGLLAFTVHANGEEEISH